MIDAEEKIQYTIDNFEVYSSEKTFKILLEYIKLRNGIDEYKDGKQVFIVVGPSGSGKSTFIANCYQNNVFGNQDGNFVPFINRHYFNQNRPENQRIYLQDEIRIKKRLLEKGKCFLMEVAQFDDVYFQFLKDIKEVYGYKVCMIYLTKRHPSENIRCVEKRVSEGYHGMKTRELNFRHVAEMYVTDGLNLAKSIPFCDSVFVINNKTQNLSEVQRPVVLMRKTSATGKIYKSPLQHYQEEFDRIINPTLKMYRRPLKVARVKLTFKGKLPEHLIKLTTECIRDEKGQIIIKNKK